MKLVIKLLGILLILVGITLLIFPEIIFNWADGNLDNKTLYIFAIVGRLVFGILLLIAAKESKYPIVIKIIAYLSLTAAIVFIFIGHESFKDFLSLIIPAFLPYTPVSGLFSLALGGFFIYAFSRVKNTKNEI